MVEFSGVVRARVVLQCLNLHTKSDWMTDPSLPKKFKNVHLFDGAFDARIHNALRVLPHSKSMGIIQRTEAVGTRDVTLEEEGRWGRSHREPPADVAAGPAHLRPPVTTAMPSAAVPRRPGPG